MERNDFCQNIVPLRGQLMAQARRLTGDEATAEDLVQDVMLRLWDMRQRLAAGRNHAPLAATMLRNRYTDYWRHRQIEKAAAATMTAVADRSLLPERADEVEIVRHIVGTLPPLQARIFRMKEIEGYETEEIAAITGCSPDSLRQHLSRARRHIRQEFLKITSP